jgi:hypothetical protein
MARIRGRNINCVTKRSKRGTSVAETIGIAVRKSQHGRDDIKEEVVGEMQRHATTNKQAKNTDERILKPWHDVLNDHTNTTGNDNRKFGIFPARGSDKSLL